ncbi:hypothetical protein Emag_004160 [Eimeria magna]
MDPNGMQMQNQLQRQMQQQQQQEEKLKAIEEQRRMAMRSLLSPEAHQRRGVLCVSVVVPVSRIHLVKPEKAAATENFIIQATRSGALQPPVSDASLIQILERISGAQAGNATATPKVVIRRRGFDEDDSDDDL